EDLDVVLDADEAVEIWALQVVTMQAEPERIGDGITDESHDGQESRGVQQERERRLRQAASRTPDPPHPDSASRIDRANRHRAPGSLAVYTAVDSESTPLGPRDLPGRCGLRRPYPMRA